MQPIAAVPMTVELPVHTGKLVERILAENPLHRHIMTASLNALRSSEISQLEFYIGFCLQKGLTIDYLAESYLVKVGDTLREQIYFQKHKKYRYSTFAEVANDVYFNNEYMSNYMYGLALTLFFWPNHIGMYRFFQETLPKTVKGNYLEIGPGHGNFINYAMDHCSYDTYLGVDISETSIRQTQEIIDYCRLGKPGKNFRLECADFLSASLPENSFDAIVMGEVLEHVEQPALFMKRIAQLAKNDAYIYISTCIDAPVVDHIYLFENTEQIADLFKACGLYIEREIFLPYQGKTLEESSQLRLPISVAYVLKKDETA